jgi:hypothetical protein
VVRPPNHETDEWRPHPPGGIAHIVSVAVQHVGYTSEEPHDSQITVVDVHGVVVSAADAPGEPQPVQRAKRRNGNLPKRRKIRAMEFRVEQVHFVPAFAERYRKLARD